MSKKIISVHNNTDKLVGFGMWNGSEGGGVTIGPHFVKGNTPWSPTGPGDGSVPNNSDCSRYYDTHRMEVTLYNRDSAAPRAEGTYIGNWSFWADDWDNFTIKYIDGIGWRGRPIKTMRGGNRGGSGTEIKLHISEHPEHSDFYQRYQLTAVAITPAEQARQTAEAFKQTIPAIGITRQSSSGDVLKALQSPHMNSLKAQAAERGFQSYGLVLGGGGSLVVGAEVCTGFLTGGSQDSGGRSYSMTSTAVSIGAEEGATGFVGWYMSSEKPGEAGGLEFFSELGAGLGVGVAY